MKKTTGNWGFAAAAALCWWLASMAQAALILTTDPTSASIIKSNLVAATDGIPTTNAAVESAVSGLTSIKVTLQNTGLSASAKVRISPIGAGSNIQLWAKNTDSNWWDINVTGWLDPAGYALPAGFNRTIDVYAISDTVGTYPLTINLVKISDLSVVATTNGTITANKATPTVTTMPTATAITYGQALSASTLSGGTGSVAGSFAFTTPTTIPNVGTANQSVTFTPDDIANYETVIINVSVTVNDLPPPSPPQNLAASDGTDTNKVLITWDAASGATSYEVWRHTNNISTSAAKISSPDPTGTSYDDTNVMAGTTYYYWVKAVNATHVSSCSDSDSGFIGVVGPLITANGLVGDVYLDGNTPVTIAVQMMNIEPYLGVEVDWWVVAFAHSGEWYYLNNATQWIPLYGNLALCQPAAQGPLCHLSATTVLDRYQLPQGIYDFWFAVDYPMDGTLNLGGPILYENVTVIVQ